MGKASIANINDIGIYGIYYNSTLIYIGKTNRKLKIGGLLTYTSQSI